MQTKPLRLFIAIELSPEVRQAIGRVQDDLKRHLPPKVVRWTNPDGIHLTLKFLGNVGTERLETIGAALAAAAATADAFDLGVQGLGRVQAFGERGALDEQG